MKKITLASFKKLIKENKNNLFIKVKSDFDGMTDSVEAVEDGFTKVNPEYIDFQIPNTLGIKKLWLVGTSGGNKIYKNGNTLEVYNCCGSCELEIRG